MSGGGEVNVRGGGGCPGGGSPGGECPFTARRHGIRKHCTVGLSLIWLSLALQ